MLTSEQIKLIIDLLEQCKSDYNWYQTAFKDAEREENNLRHEMEGITAEDKTPPKSSDRNKIATKWQDTLLRRRAAKDNSAVLLPLYNFVLSSAGINAINQLKQVLGKTRKIEEDMSNRTYIQRPTDVAPANPQLQSQLNKTVKRRKVKQKAKRKSELDEVIDKFIADTEKAESEATGDLK